MAMKLHEGMSTKSAKSSDASTVPNGGSVDDKPVRDSTAPTPATLGGREA